MKQNEKEIENSSKRNNLKISLKEKNAQREFLIAQLTPAHQKLLHFNAQEKIDSVRPQNETQISKIINQQRKKKAVQSSDMMIQHERNIISQTKQGKGRAYRALRDELETNEKILDQAKRQKDTDDFVAYLRDKTLHRRVPKEAEELAGKTAQQGRKKAGLDFNRSSQIMLGNTGLPLQERNI
eukprot:gb/GECH01013223.1/.p1 GENE.gb/GECH01013223.1/~~gb/GECH01013223.1/.p1  ORF type:complete len:183 (+),score=55.96 gb/GECH01013223.1/:1-549(+)